MVKEDLNPNYGTDLDEVTSVAEVACVIVFIRPFLCSVNMIRHVTIIDNRWGTQILSMRELMVAREQEQVTTTQTTLRSQQIASPRKSIFHNTIIVKIL